MAESLTRNFGFELIDFDRKPWHERAHNNWVLADALISRYLALTNVRGVWKNATSVAVGERYVDRELGTIFEVLVAHTTPSTGTFQAARNATSGQWRSVTATFSNRGAWAVNTQYSINDIVTDSNRVGIVAVAHTSTVSYNQGVSDRNIVTLVDLSTAVSAAAASAASAAASAASLSLPSPIVALNFLRVNAGATAYELQTPSQVLSDIGAQASHANLAAFAGLSLVADKLPYGDGAGTLALADFTSFGRSLIDDANAAAARTTLNLGTAATVNTGVTNGSVPVMNATGYPAANGSQITNLNASNLASGTVGTARLGSGVASSSTYLRGDLTWATISTPYEFVSTVAASASATVDFQSLASDYDYIVTFDGVYVSVANEMGVRVESAASWQTTNYLQGFLQQNSTPAQVTSVATTYIRVGYNVGTTTAKTISGEVRIANPANTTTYKNIWFLGSGIENGSLGFVSIAGGCWTGGTGAVTGLRFFMVGGETITGTFNLYRRKRS